MPAKDSLGRPPAVPVHAVDSVGAHLTQQVPTALGDATVGDTLDALRGRRFAALDHIYVLDRERQPVGVVPLTAAMAAAPGQRIGELRRDACPVLPDADQEHAAGLVVRNGLTSIAVTLPGGEFLGAVPPAAVAAILRREHVEDLHRMAGISREASQARAALQEPPARRARHRLPWLLAGLGGSLVAAALMGRFERLLQLRVDVAFFVPAIVYLADAIGTQTEAITIRGLSLLRTPLSRLLGGEVRTGAWIGVVLATLAWIAVWLGLGDLRLASAVAVAIFVAGAAATSVGLLLPGALARLGVDPAFGSGPLATILQDLFSIAIYLGIAHLLLT